MPLHNGGVDEPTSTACTVLPHASVISAGAPGSVAFAGHIGGAACREGVFNSVVAVFL